MLRVVVSCHKGFDDQALVQQALLRLRRTDQDAVLVGGANKAEKMVLQVWRAIGGKALLVEAEFRTGGSAVQALIDRDNRVLAHRIDLCISFEVAGKDNWLARKCRERGIRTEVWDSAIQVVEAECD